MSEHAAKDALWALLQEAISKMRSESIPLDRLRGIAFFSTESDALLISLSSFDTASRAVTEIPNFSLRFGSEAAARVVLQFAYQYFQRIESVEYQQAVLEDLWSDLVSEIVRVPSFDRASRLIARTWRNGSFSLMRRFVQSRSHTRDTRSPNRAAVA